jgi:hypothetical protein
MEVRPDDPMGRANTFSPGENELCLRPAGITSMLVQQAMAVAMMYPAR